MQLLWESLPVSLPTAMAEHGTVARDLSDGKFGRQLKSFLATSAEPPHVCGHGNHLSVNPNAASLQSTFDAIRILALPRHDLAFAAQSCAGSYEQGTEPRHQQRTWFRNRVTAVRRRVVAPFSPVTKKVVEDCFDDAFEHL